MQPRPHRTNGAADHHCNLGVTQIVPEAEHHHFSLCRRQLRQERIDENVGLKFCLWPAVRFLRHTDLHRSQFEQSLVPLAPSEMVDRMMPGYPKQPRAECACVVQGPNAPIDRQPNLLMHVFSGIPSNQPFQIRKGALAEPMEQFSERLFVTGLTPEHQELEPQFSARAGPLLCCRSQLPSPFTHS